MPTWAYIFLILAGMLFSLKLLYVVAAGEALPVTGGAPFVATSRDMIQTFLNAVSMNRWDILVDLGCGDARVPRAARRHANQRTR
ncbi:MAG: hypothetical protein HQ561_11980 [Desulfobacteraceae bacterium]|nr:hypothetical protein [Desulfobacteraceae bacterium]